MLSSQVSRSPNPRRRLHPRASLAIVLIASLSGLAGCGSHPAVLARVGPRVITVDDFNLAARTNWSQYPGNPDQARHMLLDDLVRRALMLSLADARALGRDSSVARYRGLIEEQVLTQAVSEQMIPRSVPVSDAEVAEFYDRTRIRAHLQLVYTTDPSAAAAAAAELRAGRPFDQVSNHFSTAGLLPPGGDLGVVSGGSLVDPLDSYLREAPDGAIQGPIEAPGEGWFVLRVSDRHVDPPGAPLEKQRPMFTDLLRQRKQRLISTRAFQALRAQYHVVPEPRGPQALFALLNPSSLPDSGAPAPAPELGRVVMRYTDAEGRPRFYTLGDALADLQVPDRPKPPRAELPAIEAWLQQQVIRRVVVLEARRRGLDRDPVLKRTIDERVNNALLESVYGMAVADVASASEADVQAAYDRRADRFRRLAAARIVHIAFPDSASAFALTQHGAHGASLSDAAKMAGVSNRLVEERVTFPSTSPIWGPIAPQIQALAPDEWAGPMKTAGGWMLFQVVAKETSAQTLDQLAPAVQQSVRQEALTMRREERLAALTDSLRRVVRPFEVHEDVLARIPWPPAGVLN